MNLVVLSGNLVADPELRYTGDGTPVASFRLASDAPNGETLFLTVSRWEKLAEVVAERLRKGAKVVVHGRLVPESWTAADGTKRNTISARAVTIEFMAATSPATTEGVPPRADNASEPEQTGLPF